MPVSAFVVGDESFYLVVNLLVSQEHSLYPCYLGEIDMAEKQDKFDTNCVCIWYLSNLALEIAYEWICSRLRGKNCIKRFLTYQRFWGGGDKMETTADSDRLEEDVAGLNIKNKM